MNLPLKFREGYWLPLGRWCEVRYQISECRQYRVGWGFLAGMEARNSVQRPGSSVWPICLNRKDGLTSVTLSSWLLVAVAVEVEVAASAVWVSANDAGSTAES